MGIYIIGKKEIISVLNDALSELQGDFDNQTLFEALDKLKEYPYTSNSKRSQKKWEKYIEEVEE